MHQYQQNPFIKEICEQLVSRKLGPEEMNPQKVEQLSATLYTRFESMLGRNIVEFLPKEKRDEIKQGIAHLDLRKEGDSLERIASVMSSAALSAEEFQELLKYTLQELTDEFMNS
jgi:hypothetical protein